METLTAKQMISWFVEMGAESARLIQDTPRTLTLEVVMTRNDYESKIEPHLLDPDQDARDLPLATLAWAGELRGLERIGEAGASSRTGGGLYRYTILITK